MCKHIYGTRRVPACARPEAPELLVHLPLSATHYTLNYSVPCAGEYGVPYSACTPTPESILITHKRQAKSAQHGLAYKEQMSGGFVPVGTDMFGEFRMQLADE